MTVLSKIEPEGTQQKFSLLQYADPVLVEAGCDEAGRGCLAGPVYAAAVILPKDFYHLFPTTVPPQRQYANLYPMPDR